MAQFRTVADIADEVLQKSGEVTNGNSAFEDLVITYLNKAHQAIIGGGSIFSLKVDEVWTWARARQPIILTLEPAYVLGTASMVYNDYNVTFSLPPAMSVQGWYLQHNERQTVYRITQHNAGEVNAQIDSAFIDTTGTYNFRLFKLDYDLVPTLYYIDSTNDRLDFYEEVDQELTATLTHGSYSASTLMAHIVTQMNAVSALDHYSMTYDTVARKFTITSILAGDDIFTLLGATGTNRRRSVLPLLGFDRLDYVDADSYSSDYVTNGISRLVEPFKAYTIEATNPLITSADLLTMESDYPAYRTSEHVPTQFAKVAETNDGTITVRFNAYPRNRTKIVVDYVPLPIDLQDNDASVPLIPRKDIDVLIHGAAAFILFDKEDSKWETMLKLCGGQLEAMEKKNRSELFRTGNNFAQIVPRLDYANPRQKLRYGYTWNPGAPTTAAQEVAQSMITRTLTHLDFQIGGLQKSVVARLLPLNRTLEIVIAKHTVPFAGGSISACYIDVGIAGDPTKFINGFDVMQAVSGAAQDSSLVVYYPMANTELIVRMTAVGDNLSALTQGILKLHFSESVVTE